MGEDYALKINEAFKPDLARFHNDFKREFDLTRMLIEKFLARERIHYNPAEKLFRAWRDLHDDDAGERIGLMGAPSFVDMYGRALRQAQNAFDRAVTDYFPDLAPSIDPIDESASCDDPLELIKWCVQDRQDLRRRERERVQDIYPFAKSWAHRAQLEEVEGLRKLAVGSQFLSLEAVDPGMDVSRDLTIVNDLCRDRLYFGDVIKVQVNCVVKIEKKEQDEAVESLSGEFPITLGRPTYGTLPENSRVRSTTFDCRAVKDGGVTYIVQSTSRPKTVAAAILKLGRGRPIQDRRGIRHCLVTVCDSNGWRVVEKNEDVENYRELVRRLLWVEELCEEPDTSPPNPDSDPAFREGLFKIMGRLVRRSRRGADAWVAPSVEHQMISVRTQLVGKYNSDGASHDSYRRRNIESGIKSAWFSWHLQNGNHGGENS